MPNFKIYVDDSLYSERREAIGRALGPIREMVCDELKVPAAACQFAVLPVLAMPDQPRVNVEVSFLPKPDRTPERINAFGARLRDMVEAATGPGVVVRAGALDPDNYYSIK